MPRHTQHIFHVLWEVHISWSPLSARLLKALSYVLSPGVAERPRSLQGVLGSGAERPCHALLQGCQWWVRKKPTTNDRKSSLGWLQRMVAGVAARQNEAKGKVTWGPLSRKKEVQPRAFDSVPVPCDRGSHGRGRSIETERQGAQRTSRGTVLLSRCMCHS